MTYAQTYLPALPAAGLHGRERLRIATAPVLEPMPVLVPVLEPVLVPVPSTTHFPCVRAVTVTVGVAVAGSGALLQVRQVPELVQICVSQQLLLQAIFALLRCPSLALASLLRHVRMSKPLSSAVEGIWGIFQFQAGVVNSHLYH